VTGSKPAVAYPRMPPGSPWAGDLTGVEGPLGYEIDAQESVGEPFELAASLAAAAPEVDFHSERAAAPASGSMSPREAGAIPFPEVAQAGHLGDEASVVVVSGDADNTIEAASLLRGRKL
jgi:hypothetical protein